MNYRLQWKDIIGPRVILNYLGHLLESKHRHFKIICIEAIIPTENEAISVCNRQARLLQSNFKMSPKKVS
jgi:hypothetical protein